MSKRGQVTIFIILGVFLLSIIFLVLSQRSSQTDYADASMQGEVTPLKSYATMCLEQGLASAVDVLGPNVKPQLYDDFLAKRMKQCLNSTQYTDQAPSVSISQQSVTAMFSSNVRLTEGMSSIAVSASFPLTSSQDIKLQGGRTPKEEHLTFRNKVSVVIPQDTVVTDYSGNALTHMDVNQKSKQFNGMTNALVLGQYVYDFTPAKFSNPVTVTLKLDPKDIPYDSDASSIRLAWYDTSAQIWKSVPSQIDLKAGTISAKLNHFSPVAPVAGCAPTKSSAVTLLDNKLVYTEPCGDSTTCSLTRDAYVLWKTSAEGYLYENPVRKDGNFKSINDMLVKPKPVLPTSQSDALFCFLAAWDKVFSSDRALGPALDPLYCIAVCTRYCGLEAKQSAKASASSGAPISISGTGWPPTCDCGDCSAIKAEQLTNPTSALATFGYTSSDEIGGQASVIFIAGPDACIALDAPDGQPIKETDISCSNADTCSYLGINPDTAGKETEPHYGVNRVDFKVDNTNKDTCANYAASVTIYGTNIEAHTLGSDGGPYAEIYGPSDVKCTIQDRIDFLCRFGPSGNKKFNPRNGNSGYPYQCEKADAIAGKEMTYLAQMRTVHGGSFHLDDLSTDEYQQNQVGIAGCWKDNGDFMIDGSYEIISTDGWDRIPLCELNKDLSGTQEGPDAECICGSKLYSHVSTAGYNYCCYLGGPEDARSNQALFSKACGSSTDHEDPAYMMPYEGSTSFPLSGLSSKKVDYQCCCGDYSPGHPDYSSTGGYVDCYPTYATDCKATALPFAYAASNPNNGCLPATATAISAPEQTAVPLEVPIAIPTTVPPTATSSPSTTATTCRLPSGVKSVASYGPKQFDGSGTVGSSTVEQFEGAAFTVEAWVQLSNLPAMDKVNRMFSLKVERKDNTLLGMLSVMISTDSTGTYLQKDAWDKSDDSTNIISSIGMPAFDSNSLNVWNQILVTYDGTAITYFLNGKKLLSEDRNLHIAGNKLSLMIAGDATIPNSNMVTLTGNLGIYMYSGLLVNNEAEATASYQCQLKNAPDPAILPKAASLATATLTTAPATATPVPSSTPTTVPPTATAIAVPPTATPVPATAAPTAGQSLIWLSPSAYKFEKDTPVIYVPNYAVTLLDSAFTINLWFKYGGPQGDIKNAPKMFLLSEINQIGSSNLEIDLKNVAYWFPPWQGDSRWHMLTLTSDGKSIIAYLDGKNGKQVKFTPYEHSTSLIRIGNNIQGDSGFLGYIDSLGIYSWPLPNAEVSALYKLQLNTHKGDPSAFCGDGKANGDEVCDSSADSFKCQDTNGRGVGCANNCDEYAPNDFSDVRCYAECGASLTSSWALVGQLCSGGFIDRGCDCVTAEKMNYCGNGQVDPDEVCDSGIDYGCNPDGTAKLCSTDCKGFDTSNYCSGFCIGPDKVKSWSDSMKQSQSEDIFFLGYNCGSGLYLNDRCECVPTGDCHNEGGFSCNGDRCTKSHCEGDILEVAYCKGDEPSLAKVDCYNHASSTCYLASCAWR